MSSGKAKCSICQKLLTGDTIVEITLSCQHRFHRECAKKRYYNNKSNDCPACREPDALKHAITGGSLIGDRQEKSARSNVDNREKKVDYGTSGGKSKLHSFAAIVKDSDQEYWACSYCDKENQLSRDRCKNCGKRRIDSDYDDHSPPVDERRQSQENPNHEWECNECEYNNRAADAVCTNCRQGKQWKSPNQDVHDSSSKYQLYPHLPYEDHDHSSSYPRNPLYDNDNDDVKPKPSERKEHSPLLQDVVPVYISDFPQSIDEDYQLENHIRQRVEKALFIELTEIRCYSKLGVGVMYVADKRTRDHILHDVGTLAWNPRDAKTMIRFDPAPNLVSYIVFDVVGDKTDSQYPTNKDIKQQWEKLHDGERLKMCEQLNMQYSNIFRIVSTSLEGIVKSLSHRDIRVKNHFGQIYFCADCSFFEDVPKSVTQDQLESAILNAIKETNASSCSLHVQLNKQNGTACVIAGNQARKWATMSYISINGKSLLKRNELTCRLVVHPIPKTLSLHDILQHPDFQGKITASKQIGEKLILNISDKNVFDNCVRQACIRINDKYRLMLDAYTSANNPEGAEIDADTWYDEEMLKCIKPDIIPFVAERDHFIFRCKWNARAWIEQFEKTTSEIATADLTRDPREQRGTAVDLLRHQLQMTVMLNTLASIRHGHYFVKDRQVPLKINKGMKTIVYNHESKLRKSDKMPTKIPFRQTKIRVENMDCVVAYQNLVQLGKKPVLLNMASATSPGGGYRKGDAAQEENLFRRSDYLRSLDVEMDSFLSERSNRFCCTSDGREEPLPQPHKMYPMDEFGAIYTSGLTFFRHSQDVGYEYLDRPIENVCAIAMAAYRDPKLDSRLLSNKYAVGTRKKIENVFSIAYHHGHDSLVLSAFGCGAFRNPPGHVARLFFSVIEQYAGFFDTIVFAIIDDHNSGQRLNPHGNLKPFFENLDGKSTKVETSMNKPNTMFGPYRVSSDGARFDDINIFDSTLCFYAAKCIQIGDPKHTFEYSHPPLCARAANNGKCDIIDNFVHERSFIHRHPCRYGGECKEMNDKKHCEEFDHPAECPQKGACQNTDDDHMKQFQHVSLCKEGITCLKFQRKDRDHCEKYRHCQPRCRFGNHCIMFHDKNHIREEKHPFPTPCPRTPFHCPDYDILSATTDTQSLPKRVQEHCLEYAHVCRLGRTCKNNAPLHQEKTIHIMRNLCPNDGKCNRMHQEEHLNSYTHTDVADIRRLCRGQKCKERFNKDHIAKFRHSQSHEESGVVHYYGLNSNVVFARNQRENITCITNYIEKHKWKPLPSGSIPPVILNWFRTVRPVHRCSPVIFESILLHGHAMSRDYMENLKKPKFVATSVMQHSRIRRIKSLDIGQYAQLAKEYIQAIVANEYEKANFPPLATPPAVRPGSANHVNVIKAREKMLATVITPNEVDVIKNRAVEIAQASIKLHQHLPGIGHGPDKDLGTDKRVFSILGPHLGHYYGDVFIVFKREILHHPDADYSMLAATTFGSGNGYKWRPWLEPDPGTLPKRIEHYHRTKLHASIPGHEYAIALELIAITSHELKCHLMDVNLDSIMKRWLLIDSHRTIEAHLPQLIPIDYIDHIYMPKSIFDSLSRSSQQSINALFKHCITITPHTFPLGDAMGLAGPQPAMKERAAYQDCVIKDLLERCKYDAENPPATPVEGAVITIPASGFQDSFVLPLTISHARDLYNFQNKKDPSADIIYIYWQAFHGDMMLVLSAKKIEVGKDDDNKSNQNCLLCYIAPKQSSDDSYHEQTTYLNCGSPFRHHEFVKNGKFKARSNTFHLGSNIDDFVTYCLEIHRQSGFVVLRQAGANALYNHEEIFYNFSKKELDTSELQYVHVSANDHKAIVRNLTICLEKQPDLHPTIDNNFKKDAPKPKDPPSTGASGGGSPLTRCRDNVNCLLQYSTSSEGKGHNSKYSHPCRYSELCRNKGCVLVHDPHASPLCRDDKKCRKVIDPFHRAEYRHTGMPDFLVPCHDQNKCSNTSDDHRMKYSHGEKVFGK